MGKKVIIELEIEVELEEFVNFNVTEQVENMSAFGKVKITDIRDEK